MLEAIYDIAAAIESKIKKTPESEVSPLELRSLRREGARNWRRASHEYDSQLLEIFEKVYKLYGYTDKARVVIYDNGENNAYYDAKSDSFLVSKQCVDLSSKDELEAVIGHEVGHRTQRNQFRGSIIAINVAIWGIAAAGAAIMKSGASAVFKNNQFVQRLAKTPLAIFAVMTGIVSQLEKIAVYPHRVFSRMKEAEADKLSVIHVRKPEALISWINKQGDYLSPVDKELRKIRDSYPAPTDPDKQDIAFTKPSDSPKKQTLWQMTKGDLKQTHPSNSQREKLIRKTAQDYNIPL